MTAYPFAGDYELIGDYSGDGNFAPITFPIYYFKFVDSAFGAESKAVFIQQPQNTATGDTVKPPVTVALEDSSGNIVTTSGSSVMLTLSGGTGTLSGSATALAVNGIATFSDLSINQPGSYNLTATSGSDTGALSSSFNITASKLVFVQVPTDAPANDAIKPAITVALQDGAGNVATTDSTTIITLNPVGFSSANPITGNTATLVNGIATFRSVKLAKPGFYQLQATDAAGDAAATSGKFKITGDKLRFLPQPRSGDINAPIPLTVEILNSKGMPDTSATSSVVLSLNRVTAAAGAQLSGTTTVLFVAGKAIFTTAAGPTIDTPGKYTFTATEEDLSTGVLKPTNTTAAITSKPFNVAGYHLAFTRRPVSTDVATPLSFSVAVEDPKNRVQTLVNSGGVALSFTRGAGATGQLSAYTDTGFVNGVDTFLPPKSPSFNFPGSYTITASQIDAAGVAVAGTATASTSVKILGLHIELEVPPPADVPLLKFFSMKLEVVDSKGKLATSVNDYINVTTTNAKIAILAESDAVFTDGVYETGNDASVASSTCYFPTSTGTTALTFTAGFTPGKADDPAIALAMSRAIKITGYRIAYTTEPVNTTVGDAMPVSIAIEDDHKEILKKDNFHSVYVPVEQALITSAPTGATLADYNVPTLFTDGVINFPAALANGMHTAGTISAPATIGTYTLTASVVYAQVSSSYRGTGPIPYITEGTSRKFKTFPKRLGFVNQPVGISVSFVLPAFSVQVENIDGTLLPFEQTEILDATYRLTRGGPTHDLGQATVTDGIATFRFYSIPEPGTYTITVFQNPANLNALFPAAIPVTSTPFTMSP